MMDQQRKGAVQATDQAPLACKVQAWSCAPKAGLPVPACTPEQRWARHHVCVSRSHLPTPRRDSPALGLSGFLSGWQERAFCLYAFFTWKSQKMWVLTLSPQDRQENLTKVIRESRERSQRLKKGCWLPHRNSHSHSEICSGGGKNRGGS